MNTLIQDILVPTDFSEVANNALAVAIAMAKRHQAKLHLMHVVQPNYFTVLDNTTHLVNYNDWEVIESINKENLNKYAKAMVEKYDIEIKTEVNIGYISESIEKYADSINADIIVMGTHGSSGIREFFIGSNTYSVIKNANAPVLSVPINFQATEFENVLFPVRNIDGIEDKYRSITQILKANKAKINLLGVAHYHDFESFDVVTEQVQNLIKKIKTDNINVTYNNQFCDNIAKFILEYAEAEKSDLLVINANLDNDWKRFFLGSYTQRIVNHAQIPVLSIKPQITKLEFENVLKTKTNEAKVEFPKKLSYPGIGTMKNYQHNTDQNTVLV